MNKIENYKLLPGRSLGLKVVYSDGRPEYDPAPKDFRWNLELGGITKAPDWIEEAVAENGLHVWHWAQGNPHLSSLWRKNPIWLAVEYYQYEQGCAS